MKYFFYNTKYQIYLSFIILLYLDSVNFIIMLTLNFDSCLSEHILFNDSKTTFTVNFFCVYDHSIYMVGGCIVIFSFILSFLLIYKKILGLWF